MTTARKNVQYRTDAEVCDANADDYCTKAGFKIKQKPRRNGRGIRKYFKQLLCRSGSWHLLRRILRRSSLYRLVGCFFQIT